MQRLTLPRLGSALSLKHRQVYQCRCYVFQSDDIAALRQIFKPAANPLLTPPLKAGGRIESHNGLILHDDIIGKASRDVVEFETTSGRKTPYRLHSVSLEAYVRLTQRFVTPIYPADASLIVELLDLHVDQQDATASGRDTLEILEAGTGHGALTLYLSRAIHGANGKAPADGMSLEAWKKGRRAIIHSVEVSTKYSNHARKIVRGFRRGMYYHNVDFRVGDVSAVLANQLSEGRDSPTFLSHVLLDLPSAENHVRAVADALKPDGTLIIFNPNITQILDCARVMRDQRMSLFLEKVIELGVNGTSGGREWDMRLTALRAPKGAISTAAMDDGEPGKSGQETPQEGTDDTDVVADVDPDNRSDSAGDGIDASPVSVPSMLPQDSTFKWVCRPKVGERVQGGGFLGVWKKWR